MTYAMLRLYKNTNDINHLGPAIRTAGLMISHAGGLDNGYYWAKSAKFIEDNNAIELIF